MIHIDKRHLMVYMAMAVVLFLLSMSCSQNNKPNTGQKKIVPVTANNLKEYNGTWYGSDYFEEISEQGDTVIMGSCLTLEIQERSGEIDLVYAGPPPISRIAEINTDFNLIDSCTGVFKFDDGWDNKGTGRIRFEGTSVSVDIKIEERVNTDMRIFEGEVVFLKK